MNGKSSVTGVLNCLCGNSTEITNGRVPLGWTVKLTMPSVLIQLEVQCDVCNSLACAVCGTLPASPETPHETCEGCHYSLCAKCGKEYATARSAVPELLCPPCGAQLGRLYESLPGA